MNTLEHSMEENKFRISIDTFGYPYDELCFGNNTDPLKPDTFVIKLINTNHIVLDKTFATCLRDSLNKLLE